MNSTNLPVVTDTIEHYMAQISRFDLLSREEEHALAIRFSQDGDLQAAHHLVCANLRFVVKIANEYKGYGMRLLDLVQEGNVGLMMAVKKFDPHRGNRLITYAVWWIRAYIHNFIMKSWSLVKIGTTQAQKKLFFRLNQTRNALKHLTGNDHPEELARELEVNTKEIEEMSQRMSRRDTSLDNRLKENERFTLLDTLEDQRDNQETVLARREEQQALSTQVQQALARLNPREKRIIQARILDENALTLQNLADEFDISRERIRQLEQNALKKLQTFLSLNPGNGPVQQPD